jgi:hypothetical protein
LDANGQLTYNIQKQSQSLEIANSSNSPLIAKDIILVASDTLKLDEGSLVVSSGVPRVEVANLQLAGDGALARLTGGVATQLTRDAPTFINGVLDVAQTANLAASGVLYLDSTKSNLSLHFLKSRVPLDSF